MISILLRVTLFLGMTYNIIRNIQIFTIHQIDAHDNVLKEFMYLVAV